MADRIEQRHSAKRETPRLKGGEDNIGSPDQFCGSGDARSQLVGVHFHAWNFRIVELSRSDSEERENHQREHHDSHAS